MNILVTGAWKCTEEQLNSLADLGNRVVFMQQESDDLPVEPKWVEGLICNGLFLHHDISLFPKLRFIQLTSAGFDRVPMEYVKSKGIEIHNARGVYSVPMAEFALCGVLQLYKQSGYFHENQKAHKWEKHRGLLELYGKNVCIVGCGSVGTECAKRFKAFGCSVAGVDIEPYHNEEFDTMLPLDSLEEALMQADVTVLTLPLTDETKHLMNKARFSCLKQGAVIVNIARGAVVDTEAMMEALRNNLGGAVLDVFEEEPLDLNSPLWDMENVIITPHNSFVGEGNGNRLSEIIFRYLEDKNDEKH